MISLHRGDALDAYPDWPSPTCIISDGAYGVAGFDGDPSSPDKLADWYEPHVRAWTQSATSRTSLWFWNTEIGWASVHPLLVANGWQYVQTVTWDKGVGHVAGNVNGNTIRTLPVVTEVSALYSRKEPPFDHGCYKVRDWLRGEWKRTGLPLHQANVACGVKHAATRKYLAGDHLWYMPPFDMYARLVEYANKHGDPSGRPYFLTPEDTSVRRSYNAALVTMELERHKWESAKTQWESQRRVWNHEHGLTNVWHHPALRGSERVKVGGKIVHTNQKPLSLIRRQIAASTLPGDAVWEPFGGLATASVAAIELGRDAFVAESNKRFWAAISQRLESVVQTRSEVAL